VQNKEQAMEELPVIKKVLQNKCQMAEEEPTMPLKILKPFAPSGILIRSLFCRL
jgi:hypothetical protein